MTDTKTTETKAEESKSLTEGYIIDVEDLRATVQELGAKLATADDHNDQVREIVDKLTSAGVGEATIRAALFAEFGKMTKSNKPRKPRRPNRTDKTPNEKEQKALSVMTGEPMNKRQIFSAAKISDSDETKLLLTEMQKMGWVKNVGGKGAGAGWVLTDDGVGAIGA